MRIRKALLALAILTLCATSAMALNGIGGGGGPVTINGQTITPAAVNNASINGWNNVKAPPYYASGVDTNFTGTVSAASSSLALSANYDGPNNSYIHIFGAGTDQGFSQPSAPTVTVGVAWREVETVTAGTATMGGGRTPAIDISVTEYNNGFKYRPNCPTPSTYEYCFSAGAFNFNAGNNGTPLVFTYIVAGAQAGSSHTYTLVAADDNGGFSAPSSATTVTIGTEAIPQLDLSNAPGNGTAASANGVAVTLPALPTGATTWLICKDGSLLGASDTIWRATHGATSGIADTFADFGLVFQGQTTIGGMSDWATACSGSVEHPDRLITKVTAGAGTAALTISPVATSAVTSAVVLHDDQNAFNAACAATIPLTNGTVTGSVYIPNGVYRLSSLITCAPTSGQVVNGFAFQGAGIKATTLVWDGPLESNVLLFQGLNYLQVSDFSFLGGGASADIALSSVTGNLTQDKISRIACQNNFHYCIKGGLTADGGGISDVVISQAEAIGSNRNQAAFLIQGQNNLSWTYLGGGVGSGLYPYPIVYSNSQYNDINGPGTQGASDNTVWVGVNWSGNPITGMGVPCTLCGAWAVGAGGIFSWINLNVQSSGMFFGLNSGSSAIGIHLDGVYWSQSHSITGQTALIHVSQSGTTIESTSSIWDSNLVINIPSGTLISNDDSFLSTGHATVAAYFTQVLAVSPWLQVKQKGLSLSPIVSTGYVKNLVGTAPTLTAGCNGAGSSVLAGSNANDGQFTTQNAAATSCTLTLGATATTGWLCTFTDANASITPAAYSAGASNATTAIVDFVSAANAVVQYHCAPY